MPTASSYTARAYRAHAVVLRTHKLGEADRIITLLSAEHGQIRAVAKGVRRTKSKFGARLEPFMAVDIQVVSGRSLDIVSQVETTYHYGEAIAIDYEKYTSATAMCELAEKLTDIDTDPVQYRLLLGGLAALAGGRHHPELILGSYLLRALAAAGWAANFEHCARCGSQEVMAFSVPAGGAVCASCRPAGARGLATGTPRLLAALQQGEWEIATAASEQERQEAMVVITDFLQWHVERSLRSLPFARQAVTQAQAAAHAQAVAQPHTTLQGATW